ncbi:MAG: hypothetical protein ACQEXJ_20520 [Myxococcota bacterium]
MLRNELRRAIVITVVLLASSLTVVACEKTDVVESGTYEGTVVNVEADKDEIYVESDGKKLELYFTDQTELMKGEEKAEFSALETGQQVKVTVEKKGKRLDPKKVVILE